MCKIVKQYYPTKDNKSGGSQAIMLFNFVNNQPNIYDALVTILTSSLGELRQLFGVDWNQVLSFKISPEELK